MWPNSSNADPTGPWDFALRHPALRGIIVSLVLLYGGILTLLLLLEPGGSERLTAVLGMSTLLIGQILLVGWLAWRPVAAWQKIQAKFPDAPVISAEVRVLNWDIFKQRYWYRMDSPWNGPYHKVWLMLFSDHLVWMGAKGVPWPSSPNALPVHPVVLLPEGLAEGLAGGLADDHPTLRAFPRELPVAKVRPIWDRESAGRPVPGRYRIIDPRHDGELTLVVRSAEQVFLARFGPNEKTGCGHK